MGEPSALSAGGRPARRNATLALNAPISDGDDRRIWDRSWPHRTVGMRRREQRIGSQYSVLAASTCASVGLAEDWVDGFGNNIGIPVRITRRGCSSGLPQLGAIEGSGHDPALLLRGIGELTNRIGRCYEATEPTAGLERRRLSRAAVSALNVCSQSHTDASLKKGKLMPNAVTSWPMCSLTGSGHRTAASSSQNHSHARHYGCRADARFQLSQSMANCCNRYCSTSCPSCNYHRHLRQPGMLPPPGRLFTENSGFRHTVNIETHDRRPGDSLPCKPEPCVPRKASILSKNVERFCRPVKGGAPFVSCSFCFQMLRIPQELPLRAGRRCRLRCGYCFEVIHLEFAKQNANESVWTHCEAQGGTTDSFNTPETFNLRMHIEHKHVDDHWSIAEYGVYNQPIHDMRHADDGSNCLTGCLDEDYQEIDANGSNQMLMNFHCASPNRSVHSEIADNIDLEGDANIPSEVPSRAPQSLEVPSDASGTIEIPCCNPESSEVTSYVADTVELCCNSLGSFEAAPCDPPVVIEPLSALEISEAHLAVDIDLEVPSFDSQVASESAMCAQMTSEGPLSVVHMNPPDNQECICKSSDRAASEDCEQKDVVDVVGDRDDSQKSSIEGVQLATAANMLGTGYSKLTSPQDPSKPELDEVQSPNNKSTASFLTNVLKKSVEESDMSSSDQSFICYQHKVSINGHAISQRALTKAQKKAGPVDPGSYWYDYIAGFWGIMGHECVGIIPPYIREFKYPMPVKCSGGDTGVFVNGRELHQKDLNLLASRGLPRTSGHSYVIEVSGNVIDKSSGRKLRSLGRLAPTIEKLKRGFGMHVPGHL